MGDQIVWIDDLGDDVVAFDRGTVRVVLNLSGDRLVLPERLVGRRRIVLSSEQGHVQDSRAGSRAGSRRSGADPGRRRRLAGLKRLDWSG